MIDLLNLNLLLSYWGVHIDDTLIWDNQIKHMLYLAVKLTDNQETLTTIYYSLVLPYFDYCDVVWGDCSKTRADKLQKLENRAARIITRADLYCIRLIMRCIKFSKVVELKKK